MDETPRFRFFSFSFLVGFGVGTFVGVALGLTAFLFVDTSSTTTQIVTEVQGGPSPVFTTVPVATPVRARTNTALEVRIGPGTQYAAVGTIAKGDSIDIIGRDDRGEWVAVRFPPGSSARGWLPVPAIDNLTNLYGLAIVIPTPLPRNVSTPTGSTFSPGTGGTPAAGNDATPGTVVTSTPSSGGMPDLTVVRATRLADGRVQIVISNRGNGDLVGFQVFAVVTDPTTRSETLRGNGAGLRAGESLTLETSTFLVTEPTQVSVLVDPSQSNPDANRGNNQLTVNLAPPATPTTTPSP